MPEPTIEEQFGTDVPDRTTLILPLLDNDLAYINKGPEKGPENIVNDKQTNRRMMVCSLIKENSKASRAYVARTLGISDKQARIIFEYLKENGYIHHEGPDKGGEWIIDKENKWIKRR